jgi:hypothetical protein
LPIVHGKTVSAAARGVLVREDDVAAADHLHTTRLATQTVVKVLEICPVGLIEPTQRLEPRASRVQESTGYGYDICGLTHQCLQALTSGYVPQRQVDTAPVAVCVQAREAVNRNHFNPGMLRRLNRSSQRWLIA